MKPPAVSVRDVWFTRRSEVILEAIDLSVAPADFVAVIGPNGGGKTTLLRLILGLEEPDRGSIEVCGRPPRRADGLISYVPQHFTSDPDFPATVLDLVLMARQGPRRLFRRYTAADRDRALASLARMGLADLARRQIGSLSGGQLQRALIARALAVEPEVLLLDEPSASLDTRIGRGLYETLETLAEKLAVVLVSHDLGVISRHVRRVACLNRRLHQHPSGEVSGEMLEEVYGCPIELLAHGHPHRVLDRHESPASD